MADEKKEDDKIEILEAVYDAEKNEAKVKVLSSNKYKIIVARESFKYSY
jgi:hypothetical protein